MVDAELKHQISPFLEPGERLEWAGRPPLGRYLGGALIAALFGLPFFGFSVFWELGVVGLSLQDSGGGISWVMAIFGLPFLAIGASLLFGPLLKLAQCRRMRYALTDRRALLVLTGRKPEARAYAGHQFTAIQTKARPDGSGDVFFAADTGVDRFLIESGAGKGGPFAKVGFFGVGEVAEVEKRLAALKQEAERADADARESRRSTTPEAQLAFKGSYEAAEAKLESFLAAREAIVTAAGRRAWTNYASWIGGLALVAAAILFALIMRGTHADDLLGAGLVMGILLVVGSAIGFFVLKTRQHDATDELLRGRSLLQALRVLAGDAHPKTKLHGWVDLGEARTTRPYRMANSFSSGALKTYHKHHWVRLVFATADGSKLAVSLVDRVKFKSGAEVTRIRHVRGRLEVNSARFDASRLARRLSAQGLEVCPVVRGETSVLYFGGALGEPSELPGKLAGLYRLFAY